MLGGLVVLLLLLVLLAPTLVSTGLVTSIVAGQAKNYINGSVQIGDLSVGWWSPTRLGGVKIYDDQGVLVLEVDRLETQMSLMDVIKGRYDLGETLVDANLTKCTVYEDGTVNYQKLAKSQPEKADGGPAPEKGLTDSQQSAAEPAKLPDLKGNITVRYRGTIDGPGLKGRAGADVVHIDPSSAVVQITDINEPITDDVKLVYRLGNNMASTVSLAGTIDAVEDNTLIDFANDVNKLIADQKLEVGNVDLAAAKPFINATPPGQAATTQPTDLGGIANGSITLKSDGRNSLAAQGAIVVSNVLVGGGPLHGDVFKSSKLNLPVNVTATAVGGGTTLLNIQRLGVETDQATIALTGKATQQALQNLAEKKAPGAEGNLSLVVNVTDVPGLASQLRNTLNLQKGVQITQGKIYSKTDVAIARDRVTITQDPETVISAAGKNDGKDVVLEPIRLRKLQLTAIPNGKDIPEVRDIGLDLGTVFGTIDGGGASIADLAIHGKNFDLAKARQQAAQFSDLGNLQLTGTGAFDLTSKGDVTKAGGTTLATFVLDLRNLIVKGLEGRQDVSQPRFNTTASATLVRGDDKPGSDFIKQIQNVSVTTQAGEEKTPVLDIAATVQSVTLTPMNATGAEVTKLNIPDLAKAQQQFGGFVPALKDFQVQRGQLYTNLALNYDGTNVTFTKPLNLSIRNLSVAKIEAGQAHPLLKDENLSLSMNGRASMPKNAPITADLSDLAVTSSSNLITVKKAGDKNISVALAPNGGIAGNGVIQIVSDLKRLNDLAQAFAARPASAGRDTATAGELTSGILDTTLTLDHPEQQKHTTITLAGAINNLSVTTNEQPIANEKVTIALSAVSPDDFSSLTVSKGAINSSFANTTLGETVVDLKATNIFDKLLKANLEVAVPDLPRLYSVMQAFAPAPAARAIMADMAQLAADTTAKKKKKPAATAAPAAPDTSDPAATTQPLEPLQVTSGEADIKLVVNRDPKTRTTSITAPVFAVTKLGLARGQQRFAFDPSRSINLNFAAAVTTNPESNPATTKPITEQIKQVQLTQLSGDLAVAKLEMPEPLTITNLSTQPAANGAIKLTGAIQQMTPLLAVLQGQPAKTYAGEYTLTQNVSSQQNQIHLKGVVAVPNLQTDPQAKAQSFSVNNDLMADTVAKSATITDLTVAMPDTKAMGVNMKGKVVDWETKRQLEGVVMNLNYDLAQLWPLVKPMLSPEQREQYKDLKIGGQFQRVFNVAGSYPANVPFNQAIQNVTMDGGLAIGLLDTQGIAVSDLELPLSLQAGKLTTLYANRPKAERAAKPAKFNEGTLDLSSILIDLTQDTMRASIGKNQPLVRNASINALLSDTLGKYVNPVFANSKRAKGLLNVTVNECQGVALGDAMKTEKSGRATITFSLSDMDIANPVGALLLGPVIGAVGGSVTGQAETFEGYIKDGVVTLDRGKTTQDVTLMLMDLGANAGAAGAPPVDRAKIVHMPLSFKGNIELATLKELLNVSLPPQLVAKFIPDRSFKSAMVDAFPNGIPIIMKGTTKDPKVDTGNILSKIAEAQAKAQLQKVIGGGEKSSGGKDGQKGSKDPLGGLLDQLGKDKKK